MVWSTVTSPSSCTDLERGGSNELAGCVQQGPNASGRCPEVLRKVDEDAGVRRKILWPKISASEFRESRKVWIHYLHRLNTPLAKCSDVGQIDPKWWSVVMSPMAQQNCLSQWGGEPKISTALAPRLDVSIVI